MIKKLDEIKSLLESRIPDTLNEYDSIIYDQLYLTLEKLQKNIDIDKIINEVFFVSFSAFGKYVKYEGEEDKHIIFINSMFISDKGDKAIQALIAHEIAHYILGHTRPNPNKLPIEEEYDADVLVKKWGFDTNILEKLQKKYFKPIEDECQHCHKNIDFYLIYYNVFESENMCHSCLKKVLGKNNKIEKTFSNRNKLLYQYNQKREKNGDLP